MKNDVSQMAASGHSEAVDSFEVIFDELFASLEGYNWVEVSWALQVC